MTYFSKHRTMRQTFRLSYYYIRRTDIKSCCVAIWFIIVLTDGKFMWPRLNLDKCLLRSFCTCVHVICLRRKISASCSDNDRRYHGFDLMYILLGVSWLGKFICTARSFLSYARYLRKFIG